MPETLHVRAVGDLRVSLVAPDGALLRGRYAGRSPDGSPLPDGERLVACAHYANALRHGELELVASAPVAPATPTASPKKRADQEPTQ